MLLAPLRLVADIWLRRRSGTLMVPGGMNRPTRRLAFVDGALADRMAYMYLNAAMHCEDLTFEEGPLSGRSDRAAVARLLMDRAHSLARQDQGICFEQDLLLAIDAAAIGALPLGSTAMEWLMSREGSVLPEAVVAAALRDEFLAGAVRALAMLGFIQPVVKAAAQEQFQLPLPRLQPVAPRPRDETVGPAPKASVESFENQGELLRGLVVNDRRVQRLPEREDRLDTALERAREHMRRQEWGAAHDLCVAAPGVHRGGVVRSGEGPRPERWSGAGPRPMARMSPSPGHAVLEPRTDAWTCMAHQDPGRRADAPRCWLWSRTRRLGAG